MSERNGEQANHSRFHCCLLTASVFHSSFPSIHTRRRPGFTGERSETWNRGRNDRKEETTRGEWGTSEPTEGTTVREWRPWRGKRWKKRKEWDGKWIVHQLILYFLSLIIWIHLPSPFTSKTTIKELRLNIGILWDTVRLVLSCLRRGFRVSLPSPLHSPRPAGGSWRERVERVVKGHGTTSGADRTVTTKWSEIKAEGTKEEPTVRLTTEGFPDPAVVSLKSSHVPSCLSIPPAPLSGRSSTRSTPYRTARYAVDGENRGTWGERKTPGSGAGKLRQVVRILGLEVRLNGHEI